MKAAFIERGSSAQFEHIDHILVTAHIDAATLATDIRLAATSIARTNSTQLFAILICASAAFSPSASFLASSLAQKCMK